MSGIYTSQHTGTEVDEAVTSRIETLSSAEFAALDAEKVSQNKIYILSDTNALYRSNGTIFQRLANIPYTETAPTEDNANDLKIAFLEGAPSNYYSGWIYVIYDYDELADEYAAQNINVIIGDKNIKIK